jgi:hypothetical protein
LRISVCVFDDGDKSKAGNKMMKPHVDVISLYANSTNCTYMPSNMCQMA